MRNLELLKLRFGESNLYFCEVMIKDIADSKRINSHILSQLSKENVESMDKMVLYSIIYCKLAMLKHARNPEGNSCSMYVDESKLQLVDSGLNKVRLHPAPEGCFEV